MGGPRVILGEFGVDSGDRLVEVGPKLSIQTSEGEDWLPRLPLKLSSLPINYAGAALGLIIIPLFCC